MAQYRDMTQLDVEVTTEEVAYQGFFRVTRYHLQHRLYHGGWTEVFDRECLMRGDAVGVLLYDPKKQSVLLGRQFRIGALRETSPWVLECVAGMMEPGETVESVAHRESLEEMGCEISQLIPLFDYYPMAGGSDEKVFLFCGLVDSANAEGVYGLAEEHEDIAVSAFTLEEVKVLLRENAIQNANTLIALQWLLLHHDSLGDERA